jgi:hypothetical protein
MYFINEGYLESNLWWAVSKMSNEKKKQLYAKSVHMRKLLLSVVSAGIETLIASGFYKCKWKKSAACEVSHVSTPTINSLLQNTVIAPSS